ncbi:MAG: phenylalanine--tRNA ligase subunit alpha [Parcubacteria group bacterium CG1_02_37_51]|uniref:Phenylalanine--tRNA ligase alpha subunit n=2 Tax=Candidatus Komeiliibacteriota TaxID=1817908 RepID=A0A2M8DQ77_9BACT|nr:MAG: phenylalanine--tRNA ligase subunit alpha [Parcubacteria group bacterium CG1_02_37_51]PIY95214.1 MAG: phenylalanine--tRNA ligase subunit alpha [Candidatus Komeilibacteria bacterium CG_4_10_14_0_8_um_filter_37_78]PJC01088.1 MAG: phenylalanine--tRNA ligase subunit alpha [Candidatus Komeilibacteria bacterium CG_4_9_14_0_8_um_filter_36_9]
MDKILEKLKKQALDEFTKIKNSQELEDLRIKYLGRNGELTKLLKELKDLAEEEKPRVGKLANEVKLALAEKLDDLSLHLQGKAKNSIAQATDLTLPGQPVKTGSLHPNTIIQYELEDVFKALGFRVLEGPDIESEYYNFEALNIPDDHPARDMQDTFWLTSGEVLKTHTSAMQVRAMEKYGAPLRAIFPGRCFRYEATDASHDSTFYQLEGLMIDQNISIANLIAVMKELLKGVFGKEVKVRQRPGYFPFVEPGFELDINCLICGGKGCSVCKQTGWLELLPCGLVHPNVIKAGGLDPEKYNGFAFGLGLTRLVMMKYGIDDIRLLQSGDLRFLKQF